MIADFFDLFALQPGWVPWMFLGLIVLAACCVLWVFVDYIGPPDIPQQIVEDAKQVNRDWFPPVLDSEKERRRLDALTEIHRTTKENLVQFTQKRVM